MNTIELYKNLMDVETSNDLFKIVNEFISVENCDNVEKKRRFTKSQQISMINHLKFLTKDINLMAKLLGISERGFYMILKRNNLTFLKPKITFDSARYNAMRANGISHAEIAIKYGVSPSTLYYHVNINRF